MLAVAFGTSARHRLDDNSAIACNRALDPTPLSYPGNQQAIRVIREEVDRIEWALTGIMRR
jgi:hypothetical protein